MMMERRVAFAKLIRPSPAGIFPRKRLFRRLDEGRTRPVTLIAGPPGSGKTSLVTSYIEYKKLPCLWYSADETDGDVASFFYYMGLAVEKAAPRYKRPLPLFTPEYGLGVQAFTRRYFEDLCLRLSPPYVLVIDNYQEIPSGSPIHEMIRVGLSAFPEGISSLIISRSEPPAAFAALEAGNKLHLLDWNDLKLMPEETKGIVRIQKVGKPRLYDWLHEKSDGWAAGLVLLSRAVKSRGIDSEFIKNLSPEKVFAYFANELFDRLDGPLQDFLLQTAVLSKITPGLAAALTGNISAGKILSDLNRGNYFTEKRAQPAAVYQYHALFREFLLNRAASRLSAEDLTDLRIKAGKLLMASGHPVDAAELFIQAGAWKELITLISANAPTMIGQGRSHLLEKWIKAIPEERLKSNSWMNYWLGSCRLAFNPSESRRFYERAFQLFLSAGDDGGALLAWSGAVQTFLYEFDDLRPLDRWIAWLDERMTKGASFPSPEIALSAAASMTAALIWRNPAHRDIRKWTDTTLALSKDSPNVEALMRAYSNIALYHFWMGSFDECGLLVGEMKKAIASQSVSPLRSVLLKHNEAFFNNTSIEFQRQALGTITAGLEEARNTGVHVVDSFLYSQGMIDALNEGHSGRAAAFLSKLEKTLQSNSRAHTGNYFYLSACYSLYIGKPRQAVFAAKKGLDLVLETGVPISEALVRLVLSLALFEAGNADEANRELAAAKRAVRQTGSAYFEYLSCLTGAFFEYARKNETAGLDFLRKAMILGRQKGFTTLLFFWRPAAMSRLCAKALEGGIEVDYVQNLIRKLKLIPDEESMEIETWPWPVKIYLLGRFRIHVDGKPVRFSGKVQKKPQLLLKALLAFGEEEVEEGELEDVLWPEAEGDVAHQSLETTLHRLRKWLGVPEALLFGNGLAALDRRFCWTDVWAFETSVEKADALLKQKKVNQAIEMTEQALLLYKGAFLPGEKEEPWTVSPRERLRSKFLRCINRIGRHREESGDWEKAIACYDRGLEVDNIAEEFYQREMICYRRLGRIAEALSTYDRCRRVLTAVLGVKPSLQTEEIRKALL